MKKILFAVLFTAVVLSFGSCASKPAAQEPAPVEEQVDVEADVAE
jgi:PBP1b-binding outer membrane lipoprotein LpoB